MATCPLCGKKGFFLKLGKHELCKECEIKLLTVPDMVRVINESMEIVSQSNNVETVLSRIEIEKSQVSEISRIAAGKIDPLILLGYDCSLIEMSNHINRLYEDTTRWIDAILGLIKEQLEENGPLQLDKIISFFNDNPKYWVDLYDVRDSISSLLERRGKSYGVSKEKIKDGDYYCLDGQEEMIKQIKEGIVYRDSEFFDAPPPLNLLLKSATPSRQGLYPHEILMLKYAPKIKTSDNVFQKFWYWDYSVTDPKAVLNSLSDRGFIKGGDLRSSLENLTVTEIKEELKQIHQKISGKKAELIDRLLEFGDLTSLNQKYLKNNCYYSLTSKGKQELTENQYVPYLHKHKRIGMTVWEMNRRIAHTHNQYRDILWKYFNEQASIHLQNLDFGLYWCDCSNMYDFLMEDNQTQEAFHILCVLLLLDLNGLDNQYRYLLECEKDDPEYYLMMRESQLKNFFPYEESSLKIPPSISDQIAKMQTTLALDDNSYQKAILKELQEIQLPRRIFSDEECADIVIANIHHDIDTLIFIFKKAEKRQTEKLKEIRTRIKEG